MESPDGCPHTGSGTIGGEHRAWGTHHFKDARSKPALSLLDGDTVRPSRLFTTNTMLRNGLGYKAVLALHSQHRQQNV